MRSRITTNSSKGFLRCFCKIGVNLFLFLGFVLSNALGQVTMDSVGVGTGLTNHYSSYHVEFTISKGGKGSYQLSAGKDTIFVSFNSSTTLPSSFNATDITVDGVNPSSDSEINIDGQQVSIVTPNSYKNTGSSSGKVTVNFAASGKIRNPENAGTYSIDAKTNKEGSDSGTYSISTTTTTVSKASVTPNPSVEERSAKYTIGFNVGAGGYLESNQSTIHIDFPSGTFVPDGSIAGVEINGTAASANGDSSNKEITIVTPVDIDNKGAVNVAFGPAAGLKNPSAGGNQQISKTLSVHTSSETTSVTSDDYVITSAQKLSSSAVNVTNDTANAQSRYDITFTVSADDPNTNPVEGGPLNASNGDLIYLTFRGSTNLPSSISTSDISVTNTNTGFSGDAASVSIEGDTTVIIGTPVNIDEGEEVSITFTKGAGIQNPAISGNYKLKAETRESDKTTVIDESNTSNPYSIITPTSGVSQANVSLTNNDENVSSDYTLNFSTGKYGRLLSGTSSISVVFPDGAVLSSGSADVNGVSSNNLTVHNSNSGDKDTLEVQVPSGVTIGNSGSVTLDIYNSIVNPSAGTYNLGVYTSVEPTLVNSQTINIGGTSVSPSSPTLGSPTANSISSYDFPFSGATSFTKNDGYDYVRVNFPEGTIVPSDITVGDISISGVSGLVSVSVDSSSRQVTVYVDDSKTPTEISFNSSAGIINPSVPDANYYKASISTSKNTQPANTPTYEITAHSSSPAVDAASASPSQKDSTNVGYEIKFTTGSNGRLDGNLGAGSDTIRAVFDRNGTLLPGSISANEITVNGVTAKWAETQTSETGNSDTLLIKMPDGLTIKNSSQATISINGAAGVDNAGTSGTFTLKLNTTTETGFESTSYELFDNVKFTFGSLSKSNSVTNASSSYNFSFTTSTSGGLTADSDSILINFPENTHLPTPFSEEYVKVEGTKPSENPKVNGQQLSIKTPVNINQGSKVSVQISSSAEILNPSLVASDYTFSLHTSQESDTVTSSQYSTTTASSNISNPNISLSNQKVEDTVSYDLGFNTGTQGRLIESGGSLTPSKITVKFPTGTDYSNLSATIKGNSVSNISQNGNKVSLTLPNLASDSVWNEDDVSLNIDGIINPSNPGDYKVEAKTSVEPTYIKSFSYTITDAPPVSISNLTLNSSDTVNQFCNYSFDFTTDSTLASGDGTLTITFPESSEIPNTINNAAITIGSNAANDVKTSPINSEVTITVPNEISSGATRNVTISKTAKITNPKEPANNYNLKLRTSEQPSDTTSSNFTMVASKNTYIYNLGVEVNPEVNDEPTNWTIGFRTGSLGALDPGRSTIYLDMDQSIFNEDPIPSSAIKVNSAPISGVNRSGSVLEITVPSGATIKKNDTVTVEIDKAAGIQVDTSLVLSKRQGKAKSGGSMPNTQATNNYSGSTSPEPSNTTTSSNPLPIELADFSVNEGSENGVARLTWKTATERNNYRFYIERRYLENSKTEESADNNWKELDGYVEGSGTTNSAKTYTYTDNTLERAGLYQYRIRQVDFDGSSKLYGPYEYRMESPESFKLEANYPNPFNPTTTIPYSIPEEAVVKIKVYNVIGKQVQTLVNSRQKAGAYKVNFDGTSLSSGTYFIRFEAAGRRFVKKMLLLK